MLKYVEKTFEIRKHMACKKNIKLFLWPKQIVCVLGKMIRTGFVALIRDQTMKNTTGHVKESEFKGQSGNL